MYAQPGLWLYALSEVHNPRLNMADRTLGACIMSRESRNAEDTSFCPQTQHLMFRERNATGFCLTIIIMSAC